MQPGYEKVNYPHYVYSLMFDVCVNTVLSFICTQLNAIVFVVYPE